MTDLPSSSPSRVRWLRIALALSLALNLAVLGVVGGAALRPGKGPVPVRDLGFGPFSEALSPDDRKALREAFQAQGPEFREARRAMRDDFAAVLVALRADPFDAAALQVIQDNQNRRGAEMMAIGQKLIFERVATMTPQERRDFADRLEKSLTRGHDKDKGKGEPKRP